MKEHELKTWPEYYAPLERGEKTLELRKDDRDYQVGDILHLREWEPVTSVHVGEDIILDLDPAYTGRSVRVLVTHIVRGGEWLAFGYVAMSVRKVEP